MEVTKLSEKVNILLVVVLNLCLLGSVYGLVVRAPNNVLITEQNNSFDVYVYNDSDEIKDLRLEVNVPVEYTLKNMPNIIAPKNSANITVTINYNEKFAMQSYNAFIVVDSGNEKITHNFKLKFAPPKEKIKVVVVEVEKQKNQTSTANLATGMLVLPSIAFKMFLNILSFEFLVDVVLAIIAAVLLIAFISRYVKRLHEAKL